MKVRDYLYLKTLDYAKAKVVLHEITSFITVFDYLYNYCI